jgi:hypothetical protein
MSILNNFEKHQLSRTLMADFDGPSCTQTFNYLSDLILYKHTCDCESCKTLSRDLTVKINKIVAEIKLSKISHKESNIIPLTINDTVRNILADFEHFHIKDITLRDFKMTTEK